MNNGGHEISNNLLLLSPVFLCCFAHRTFARHAGSAKQPSGRVHCAQPPRLQVVTLPQRACVALCSSCCRTDLTMSSHHSPIACVLNFSAPMGSADAGCSAPAYESIEMIRSKNQWILIERMCIRKGHFLT